MLNTAKKVMVLGIDAPIVPRLHRWAMEGKLPTLQKLIREGVYAPNCLVPFPTITPPNWTTIVTGAWPGTHGITDFEGHVPGDPLDSTHQNFDSSEVQAETIWSAAARAGKRTIVMNYPVTWPSTNEGGWQVAGYGLNVNDWRLGVSFADTFSLGSLTHDILLSTEPYPFGTEVTFQRAHGWEGIEHSPKALEAQVTLYIWRNRDELEPVTWYLLVDQSGSKGYDTVIMSRSKDNAGIFARPRLGEWTPNIYDTFQTKEGPKKAVFRCKLMELSKDAQQFRLYIPGLCSLEGWGVPRELEEEIKIENGLPMGRPGWEAFLMEWIDAETLVETNELHHNWIAEASHYLFKNKPWDLYCLHVHTPDWMYHTFSAELDPLTAPDRDRVPEFQAIELAIYQSVDRCLGRILEAAGDDTLIVVTSDHGAKAKSADFHVEDILEPASLLSYLPSEDGRLRRVDWNSTKAVGQRSIYVYVNVKGRDPEGIVEPGEEYEKVRDQIIKALHEYVDPKTGLKPIVLALRKEDSRVLGLYGDRVGDIVYAVDPRFSKEHGNFLPTTEHGIGSLRGLFIISGPGVKRGEVIERTVSLTDIVPTICYLAEIPIPKDCEGAVIYQALEDPDTKMKELQALRRNQERLKRMVERPPMC